MRARSMTAFRPWCTLSVKPSTPHCASSAVDYARAWSAEWTGHRRTDSRARTDACQVPPAHGFLTGLGWLEEPSDELWQVDRAAAALLVTSRFRWRRLRCDESVHGRRTFTPERGFCAAVPTISPLSTHVRAYIGSSLCWPGVNEARVEVLLHSGPHGAPSSSRRWSVGRVYFPVPLVAARGAHGFPGRSVNQPGSAHESRGRCRPYPGCFAIRCATLACMKAFAGTGRRRYVNRIQYQAMR